MRAITRLLAVLCALTLAGPLAAATIERGEDLSSGLALVTILGDIERGDATRFRRVISGVERGVVVLHSPGGSLVDSLEIGQTVRERGLATLVMDEAVCTSGCALIWLGGVARFLHQDGLVGFHAAFTTANGSPEVTGSGNALVGAYLNGLGFSTRLVAEVTRAGPSEMTWLTVASARRIGLDVEWLGEDRDPDVPAPQKPDGLGPSLALMERDAATFVWRFMRHLEEDGPFPPALVDRYYARQVDYFGEWVDRDEIRRRQGSYARRWPVHVIVLEGEPEARCWRNGRCIVTGEASFSARSEARNRRSDGRMRFVLRLEKRLDTFRIVGESSEVLDRNVRPIRSADTRLVRRIQGELLRVGCDPGPIDGVWGPQTAAALGRFNRAYQVYGPVRSPTERDLVRLKSVRGIICKF